MLGFIIMRRLLAIFLVTGFLPAFTGATGDGIAAATIMTVRDLDDTTLAAALADSSAATRRAALFRIAEARRIDFETAARNALADPAWSVRRMACRTLEFIGTEANRQALEKTALGHDSTPVRARAIMALGGMADSRSLPVLLALLDDDDFAVRGTAAQQIGFFGDSTVVDRLARLAEADPFPYVRVRATGAIERLVPPVVPPVMAPASVKTNDRIAPGFFMPALFIVFIAAAILLVAFVCRRTGNRLPLRGFLLAATIAFGAALLVLLLLRFAPFGRSGKAPAYELILDPPLADHPLILQSGGADSFLEGIAGEIRAAGLGIDPTFRVAVSPELEAAFDPLRDQYDMDRVLGARSGARREPTPIVITGRHLFVEPFYTVLGRASNRGGVISTRWLDPVFLGEGESTEREAALFRRQLAKVLIHELGHARGLPHCDNRGCVMRSVEEAAEDFHRLDAVLCATCLERIRGAK